MTQEDPFDGDDSDEKFERFDDDELLERAFASDSGDAISGLYHADDAKLAGYAKVRDARLALLAHFAFWTRQDRPRMKSLYNRSTLASVPGDDNLDDLVDTILEIWDREDRGSYTPGR